MIPPVRIPFWPTVITVDSGAVITVYYPYFARRSTTFGRSAQIPRHTGRRWPRLYPPIELPPPVRTEVPMNDPAPFGYDCCGVPIIDVTADDDLPAAAVEP